MSHPDQQPDQMAILDIKLLEDADNIDQINKTIQKIKDEISFDGIQWLQMNIIPIAYGLMKIQAELRIIQNCVELLEIIDQIQEIDNIQSVDIVGYHKL
ncbi:Elongation factor 1-delta [Paramecium bursaria]